MSLWEGCKEVGNSSVYGAKAVWRSGDQTFRELGDDTFSTLGTGARTLGQYLFNKAMQTEYSIENGGKNLINGGSAVANRVLEGVEEVSNGGAKIIGSSFKGLDKGYNQGNQGKAPKDGEGMGG